MKKTCVMLYVVLIALSLTLMTGCGKEETPAISVHATTPIEVDAEALSNVSVTLPEGITRENVSDIQHDFIQDEKQVGGIVIVDISDEMLDSPYDYLLPFAELLGEQLMPDTAPEEIEFIGAGGNNYAYMEIYTGNGEEIRYYHYLFRGQDNIYDVWFDNTLVDLETRNDILAAVSSQDITAELNKSPF